MKGQEGKTESDPGADGLNDGTVGSVAAGGSHYAASPQLHTHTHTHTKTHKVRETQTQPQTHTERKILLCPAVSGVVPGRVGRYLGDGTAAAEQQG